MRLQRFPYILLIAITIIFSCSDPAEIGAGLLEEDRVDLLFSEDIAIDAKTIEGVPIEAFNFDDNLPLSPFDRVLMGKFIDPIFGTTTASVYTQVSLGLQEPPRPSKPRGDSPLIPEIDSIVLSLAYDTLGGYGTTEEVYGFEVFFLEEVLQNTETYDSDKTFATASESIGSIEFMPNLTDRLRILDYSTNINGDTVTTDPHIRIHLDARDFIEVIGGDTAILQENLVFWETFKGLHIQPTKETSGLLAFDFGNDVSKISMYYKENADTLREYNFELGRAPISTLKTARVANIKHDYTESTVQTSIDRNNADSIFLQGLSGLNAEISFPEVSDFRNIVVNKAELEFTVANADTTIFDFPAQLIGSQTSSANRQIIGDVQASIFAQRLNPATFGGFPISEVDAEGVTLIKYRINISKFFQQVTEGNGANSFILSLGAENPRRFFEIPAKPIDPSRIVFFGPNHPKHPLTLKLTYTKL